MRPCKSCGKNRDEKFFVGERGHICDRCRKRKRAESAHAYRVLQTYGISKEDYQRLVEAQDGACAICGGSRNYNLDVDHDHKTGFTRGLLCKLCNRYLLPGARDQAEILRKAADYLDSPPAHKVIGLKKAQEPQDVDE